MIRTLLLAGSAAIAAVRAVRDIRRTSRRLDALIEQMRADLELEHMRRNADRDMADRACRREHDRDTLQSSESVGPCDLHEPFGETLFKDREALASLERFQLGLRKETGQA